MATAPGGVEVGRVSVRVVPDTSRLFEDLKADLDRIEAESSINIRASVDSAQLVESARAAVSEAQALAGNIDIKANVDTSQMGELSRAARSGEAALAGLTSKFSAAGLGAAGLVLALGPVAVALGAVAAALAAPLAIVGGGVTLFAFLAGFAIKDTLKQQKDIATLQTKLAGLTKGTAEYAQTQKALADAQKSLKLSGGLPFITALDNVKSALHSLPTKVILQPIVDGLNLLAATLPKLTPIVSTVSRVLDGLVNQFGNLVKSPGFKGFVEAFAKNLGHDMRLFAAIAKNVLVGVFGLFGALNNQLSGGVLKGLVNITSQFAAFGKSAGENKGLKSFIDYVKQALPPAGKIIGDTFSIIGGALAAVAPTALAFEKLLAGILDGLKKMGPLATPLAAALAGIFLPFIGGPEVGAVLGLAAAFKELYDRCKPLQGLIKDMWGFFKRQLLPIIEQAAQQILPAASASIKDIGQTIRQNKGFLETFGKLFLVLASAVIVTGILAIAGAIRAIGPSFKFSIAGAKFFTDALLVMLSVALRGVALFVGAVLDQFGSIVNGAAAAFGWLPKIGPKIKSAASSFNSWRNSVVGNITGVANGLDNLKAKIDAIGKEHPSFKVTVDDLKANQQLEALQQFRLRDKTLNVDIVERAVGRGGGIGIPTGVAGQDGTTTGRGSSAAGSPKAYVNVEKMNVSDGRDILRKAHKQFVSKAGGGVHLRPSPTFGGVG